MHPAQTQAAQPTQMRTGGEAAAAAPGRIYAPTRDTRQAPDPNPMAQPTSKRTGGIAAAAAPGRISEPTRDYGPSAKPKAKGHSQSKSVPAAEPPQLHPVGQTHQRRRRPSTSRSPKGTANPKAYRRHSRSSRIRLDKRNNVDEGRAPTKAQAAQPTHKRTGGTAAAAKHG